MTTDRELLEMAARAAGVHTVGDWLAFGNHWCGLRAREDDAPGGYCWNPIADDAQALRLAVKLGLSLDTAEESSYAHTFNDNSAGEEVAHLGDPYAATRRAIVRAAASLGSGITLEG